MTDLSGILKAIIAYAPSPAAQAYANELLIAELIITNDFCIASLNLILNEIANWDGPMAADVKAYLVQYV
jgi:hypothetical protein